jgi:hypothetical protein
MKGYIFGKVKFHICQVLRKEGRIGIAGVVNYPKFKGEV